ncbi:MAG: hypothetical protein ABSA49_17445 [Rhizomicrobium sp.]
MIVIWFHESFLPESGADVKIAIVPLLALMLAGCAWFGPQDAERTTLQFQTGVTRETEVIARLGQPNVTTWGPKGTVVDVYKFIPASALPPGDAMAGSSDISLTFDSNGILLAYSHTAP